MTEQETSRLVERIAASMVRRGWRLVTAESCTGGWIAKCCTDRPGSSDWFDRGFVSYSNAAKEAMLQVDAEVIQREGAVSKAVALAMARGARKASGVEAAIAVTGIAGPDGGTPDKPVGTVWFAWDLQGTGSSSECVVFAGDRESVRRQTVRHALAGLHQRLSGGVKSGNSALS